MEKILQNVSTYQSISGFYIRERGFFSINEAVIDGLLLTLPYKQNSGRNWCIFLLTKIQQSRLNDVEQLNLVIEYLNNKEKSRQEIFNLMETEKYKEEIQIFSQQFENLQQISRELNVDIKIFADPELTQICKSIVNSVYSSPIKVHFLKYSGKIFTLVPVDVKNQEYGNKEKIDILESAFEGLMEVAVKTLSEERIKAYQAKVLKIQDSFKLSGAIAQLVSRKNEIKNPILQPKIKLKIPKSEERIEEQKIDSPFSAKIEKKKILISNPFPIHKNPFNNPAAPNPMNSNAFKLKSIQGSFINPNMHSLNSLISLKNNPLYETVPLPYFNLNLAGPFPDQQVLKMQSSIELPQSSSIKTFPSLGKSNWEEEKFN